jgi:hypothetical protein
VTLVNGGPQDGKLVSLDVRLILVGELTLVLRVTSVTDGAHLKESPTLPELLVPPLPEKVMVSGLVDHRLLGTVRDATPTEAYTASITRLIETPIRRCGRYCLIRDDNCKSDDNH